MPKSSRPFKLSRAAVGFAAIALAAMLWAIAAIAASSLFQSGVSPLELAMARAIIAAIGLGVVHQLWQPNPKFGDWHILALGLSLALVTLAYYIAIERLAVAIAVVIQYTAPVLIVIWAMLKHRKVPALSVTIALIAAIAGVTLISELPTGNFGLDGLGLLMACLSAFCFASYTLLSESAVATYGAVGVMFRAFTVSSLFWIAVQFTQGFPAALFVPEHLPGVLLVGIGGTLIPFSLYCWGIERVQSERGAIAATLEPLAAAIFAWIGLGQTLSVMQILGGILILTAVVSLQIKPQHGCIPILQVCPHPPTPSPKREKG
ncbi:MAG: EamA family transporter, partial [Leptolyngbyaceae cyanobacterium SL_5_9]|nr:EamA family transporter [Leptolyngbyaceae cyanobacterium SL_5_9]